MSASGIKVWDGESEMAQAARFGSGEAFGRVEERKEFELSAANLQIKFVRLALRPISLADDLEAKNARVEILRPRVIRNDEGDVMELQ